MESECCNAEMYYELWSCNKNPEGRTDKEFMENYDHGNDIDGTTTCEDDYCNPQYERIEPTDQNYIENHEVHERCGLCEAEN